MVIHRLVDLRGRQTIPVGRLDPRVEDLVGWPTGDDHCLALARWRLKDKLQEDAVALPNLAVVKYPLQEARPFAVGDSYRAQAKYHRRSSFGVTSCLIPQVYRRQLKAQNRGPEGVPPALSGFIPLLAPFLSLWFRCGEEVFVE